MKISEYVSIGHPDKIADYISEYILDRLIEQDSKTRYALEVQIKDNFVTLGGEITTNAIIDYEKTVKDAVNSLGYNQDYKYIWGNNAICGDDIIVTKHISLQSNDISQGVNNDGWGDQGIMFGMAIDNIKTAFMPKDYYLAKKLAQTLYNEALTNKVGGLDIKTQVVLDENVKKVIVAIPQLYDNTKQIIDIVHDVIYGDYELIINGTGKYVVHSSVGDCGTTGRKLSVDFYGGNCNVGGGSPWTKDGTKADLTLNLLARFLALEQVKNGNKYSKVGIGCCIGRKELDITYFNEFNQELDSHTIDKSPKDLISYFGLDKPIYADLCKHGLFNKIK